MSTKPALRSRLRALRRSLAPEARAAAHAAMIAHLAPMLADKAFALYAGTADEADVRAFPAERCAWPRVVGPELELALCAAADLVPGYRGILEPPSTALPIALGELDVLVIPGLAFDRLGHRLGQGGGHYDRLLSRARADPSRPTAPLVIGLAYALQLIAAVPHEPHDQRVDRIVTERGVIAIDPD